MLQIISGKFFLTDDRYCYDGKGITFSNYSWLQPIKTRVATLEPVDTYASVASYVICYVNQIEKEPPPKKNFLVRTGDSEIVEQFQLLCMFGLRAFFHQDRDTVAVNCRTHRLSSADYHVPSALVPRLFDRQILGTLAEVESFVAFVDKVIGLPRETYQQVMTSLRSFAHAQLVIGHNIDLAYSLIIYALEALSRKFDGNVPVWDDYHDDVRRELDPILDAMPIETANRIRSALLSASHLRAMRRFVDFASAHVSEAFFTTDAALGHGALRKSELASALRNAYHLRSQYAHELQPIREQLRHTQLVTGDVFRWQRQPYLTLGGLARLCHHIIMQFIQRCETVEREDVQWRQQLPGLVLLEVDPRHWIWQHENFRAEAAAARLSGFLCHLETVVLTGSPLTDLRPLLAVFEGLVPGVASRLRIQMLSIYFLYNAMVVPEGQCANWDSIRKDHGGVFCECTIETMLTMLLLGHGWSWDVQQTADRWTEYAAQRQRKNTLSIPPLMELAILARIAQRYRDQGDAEACSSWLDIAIPEGAGRPSVQSLLREARDGGRIPQYSEICDAAKKSKAREA